MAESSRPWAAEDLAAVVCAYRQVPWQELVSQRRFPRLIAARFVLYWMLYDVRKMSYPEIAIFVNRKSHTTIRTGVKRCRKAHENHPAEQVLKGMLEWIAKREGGKTAGEIVAFAYAWCIKNKDPSAA